MKNTVIIIGVLAALNLIGCKTSREMEASTQEVTSTTSTQSSQVVRGKLDSLAKIWHVELDSFELTIENAPLWSPECQDTTAALSSVNEGQRPSASPVIGPKITLRARRAEINNQTIEKECSAQIESTTDSVSHNKTSAKEEKTSLKQTAVEDPPDMTMVIIGVIASIIIALIMYKKIMSNY